MDLSTEEKIAKDDRASIPREAADEAHVWRKVDSVNAAVLSGLPIPNAVSSLEDFWDGLELAMSDAESGRACDAHELFRELRERHSLA
ncbi:MAG: hypothetical protein ACI361_08675 [Atopobiaceae bacterium]